MSPEFDPSRVSIMSGWLVYDVGEHTCGGYGPESGYAHEPGCGLEPMVKAAELPALLDAAEQTWDALPAERDALAAAVERVRALHHGGAPFVRPGGQDRQCSCGGRWPCLTARALDGEARP